MEFNYCKNGEEIKNFTNWKKLGGPKSEKHWKPGRSSQEMANFALNKGKYDKTFKERISEVLKECNINAQDFKCEPEAITSLGKGMGRGGCRNHDLLMIGKDCVIGIEAKVSEPFGKTIDKVIKEQSNNKDKKHTRAYKLAKFLAEGDCEKQIGYQLFTATYGTMCAALNNNLDKCILLVIVFAGNINCETNDKSKCEVNENQFNDFVDAVGAKNGGKITRTIDGKEVNCWIKKIEVYIL